MLLKTRPQSLQGRLDIAHRSDCYRMSSPDVRRVQVDLNNRSLIWIKLGPGEIRSEQEQHIAVEDGMVAGASADETGHADIVGIVVFKEVLATRRMGHWRLQPRRRCNHLVMRARAAGACV